MVITFEKPLFLLLIPHRLLDKSKITALSLPLSLAILCQIEVNSQIFGVVTILWCVPAEPLLLHFWLIHAELQSRSMLMAASAWGKSSALLLWRAHKPSHLLDFQIVGI